MPKDVKVTVLNDRNEIVDSNMIIPEGIPETNGSIVKYIKAKFDKTTGSKIHVKAVNYGILPSWHEYKGNKAWIFADEVIVE